MSLATVATAAILQFSGSAAASGLEPASIGPAADTRLISASLIDIESGDHVLDLNGANRAGEAASFDVNVTVHSLPCQGMYRYVTYGEDLTNGASTSLEAELRVRGPTTVPSQLTCGGPLPARAGQASAFARLFNHEGRPLRLRAEARRPDGSFKARLDLDSPLECASPYWFFVGFSNRRSRRLYRYTVNVIAASASLDNGVERVGDCGLPRHSR